MINDRLWRGYWNNNFGNRTIDIDRRNMALVIGRAALAIGMMSLVIR